MKTNLTQIHHDGTVNNTGRSLSSVLLVMATFLSIALITSIMGPIFPQLKSDFQLSNTITAFFPFAFFISYGVMSIPAGLLTELLGEKRVMLIALLIAALGSLLVATLPSMSVVLFSLFCIGSAMALLQVVINPLLRVSGGEEHYAFYSMLGQLVFACGGMIAPKIYSYLASQADLVQNSEQLISLAGQPMSWISMYQLFVLLALVLILAVSLNRFPHVELKDDERVGGIALCISMFKNKTVLLFFFAIMAYVGAEVGITTTMSLFLQEYHHLDPITEGSAAIANFWQFMVLGCVVGLFLMKLFNARYVLAVFCLISLASYCLALWGSTQQSLLAYSAMGFFLSVMFPAIMSLALNSLDKNHGSFAGILCSGIAGGALVPVICGSITDFSESYRAGALFIIVPLLYILFVSIKAKPIIENKTLFSKS
ncbi:MFS transporter [uncultured Pseudoteredinibacter sp.]|uniref:MFS transporter n=1 Tax=uncultured Pseudoteredinibacter sp. TaxID=1641701 RepID=UPI0026260B2C|nr:MFS transporter [uncultured Pseudoteredinibacter sp.]